jgi:hypothetical protein
VHGFEVMADATFRLIDLARKRSIKKFIYYVERLRLRAGTKFPHTRDGQSL